MVIIRIVNDNGAAVATLVLQLRTWTLPAASVCTQYERLAAVDDMIKRGSDDDGEHGDCGDDGDGLREGHQSMTKR